MSNMVIDIRGTHGSGKSTIPLQLIQHYEPREIYGHPLTYEGKSGVLGYHIEELNTYILGRYETACGGCDGIKTQTEIKKRVETLLPFGHVLLEGILVAHTFGPWEQFARGRNWHFCFLDTDLDTCIARVNARRERRGVGLLEDPHNIVRDWHRIRSLEPQFREAGHATHWIKGAVDVEELLRANQSRSV